MLRSLAVIFFFSFIYSVSGQKALPEIDVLEPEISRLLLSRNDSALSLSRQMYDESIKLAYLTGMAKGELYAGLHFLNVVRFDSAYKYLNRSDSLFKKHILYGDSITSGYVKLAEGLGRYYINRRQFELAEAYLQQSLSLYERSGDTKRIVSTLNLLGGSKGRQGDFTDALSFFLEAYRKAENRSKSTIVGNIALCYKNLSQYEEAVEYLKVGLQIDIDSGWGTQINKLNTLGNIYLNMNQLDSSLYFTSKALEAARKFDNPRSAALALVDLANRYVLDDQDQLGEQYMNEALQMADSAGISLKEDFYFIKSRIFYRQKLYDSSVYYGRKALKSSQENSNKQLLIKSAKRLSESYEVVGKMDSALYFHKLFHTNERENFNVDNQRKFTRLFSQMENMEQLQDIELLEKQSELDAKNRLILIGLLVGLLILGSAVIAVIIYRQKNRRKQEIIKEMRLNAEIEKRELQLQQQALHMINMNNNITEVEHTLREMKKKSEVSTKDVQKVLSNITVSKSMDKEWQQFEGYFRNIHPNFSSQLLERHDNLTQQERRLSALIKMDLSNREIAGILNIEQRSVIMNRYRLKKKFGLGEDEDLEVYIQKF